MIMPANCIPCEVTDTGTSIKRKTPHKKYWGGPAAKIFPSPKRGIVTSHKVPVPRLELDTELNAVGAWRRILREADQEVSRCRRVDQRVGEIAAPEAHGIRPVVHVPMNRRLYIVLSRLTQLIVCLGEPTAVVKVLPIQCPVSC